MLNREKCEQFIMKLKLQKKLREWRMYYRACVPNHCKTAQNHPWNTFDKFLKWHVVDLYE